ncbi:hypothetical protein ABEF93_004277 [Exophiala dermatitidis]
MADKPDYKGKDEAQASITPAPAANERLDLEYPQIPLHLSLESLLVHSSSSSLSISNPNMSLLEANAPALGDSWASLTDVESSNEEDLRSEITDVGSLLDVHTSDDVRSITEEANVEESTNDGGPLQGEPCGELPSEGSTLSESSVVDVHRANGVGAGSEDAMSLNAVSRHILVRPLTEPENQKLRQSFSDGLSDKYLSIIHMPLLTTGLGLDALNYFKVLLLGRHVEQFKPEIQRKLGDSLVSQRDTNADTRPTSLSRFHLVPSCFGPGSEPEFADLVAIDKQIDFECYDVVEAGSSTVPLSLKNSQSGTEVTSECNGRGFAVSTPRWIQPDIAIICVHIDGNNNLDRDSRNMITFADRHGIPTILIRMDRGWQGYYGHALTTNQLYETIESDGALTPLGARKLMSKFPVDMAAFLNLDPVLLNKHVAYLVSSSTATGSDDSFLYSLQGTTTRKPSRYWSRPQAVHGSPLRNILIVLWVIGVYAFLCAQLWPLATESLSSKSVNKTMTSETLLSSHTHMPSQTSEDVHIGAGNPQPTDPAPAIYSTKSPVQVRDDAMHFQVAVVSNRKLMVNLPNVALRRKKRSPLAVVLTKANRILPTEIHELFDGVVSVQFAPDEAYGDIEVNLTMSRPPLSELLTVSLGASPARGRKAFGSVVQAFNSTLRQAMSLIPTYLPSVEFNSPLSNRTRDLQSIQRDLKQSIKTLWTKSKDSAQSRVTVAWATFLNNTTSSYSGLKWMKGATAEQGAKIVRQATGEIYNAQAILRKLLNSFQASQLPVDLNSDAVTKKLSAAQTKARHIVFNAAKKLQSRRGSR